MIQTKFHRSFIARNLFNKKPLKSFRVKIFQFLAVVGSFSLLPNCTTYREMSNEVVYMREVEQPRLRGDLAREETATSKLLNERARLERSIQRLKSDLANAQRAGASPVELNRLQRRIQQDESKKIEVQRKLIGS